MTDQTPANLSKDDVAPARDWAAHVLSRPREYLPMENSAARALQALLPAPPLPTLADMTPEERGACQWMQADTELWGRVVIVLHNAGGGRAVTLNREGHMAYEDHGTITPRPDLPRMEWPGEKPAPAPALPEGWRPATHPKHGRVIVTNTTPNRNGHVYFTRAHDSDPRGFGWDYCTPDVLTFLGTDQEADTPTGPDHLAVSDVIESADDPRIDALPVGSILLDCDGETAIKRSEAWTGDGYTPIEDEGGTFGPWKVLHIPKEADQ